ncbi:hypothetical protein MXB_2309 [Myxobolus squamalis]|nr:hypothetical protein MXB_2309 [Myxobolus squamalis]
MDELLERALVKISHVLKYALESNEISALTCQPSFINSINLIKEDTYLFKNSMLGYITNRRSCLSRLYHTRATKLIVFYQKSNTMRILQHFEKLIAIGISFTAIWIIIILFGHYIPSLRYTLKERVLRSFLNPTSALLQNIMDIRMKAIHLFNSHVSIYSKTLSSYSDDIQASLGPMKPFKEALDLVRTITSITLSQHEFEHEVIALKKMFVTNVINSLEMSCSLSAVSLSRCSMAIFLVNCLVELRNEIAEDFLNSLVYEKLQLQISAHVDTLISEQVQYMFDTFKMTKIYQALQAISEHQDLNFVTLCDCRNDELSIIVSEFRDYLKNNGILLLTQLELLVDSEIK